MLRSTSFRTGQPSYEPADEVSLDDADHGDHNRRTVPDDGARKRTARRLMVMRLRVEITTREAAQPSAPRIEEARQELRALTGVPWDTD